VSSKDNRIIYIIKDSSRLKHFAILRKYYSDSLKMYKSTEKFLEEERCISSFFLKLYKILKIKLKFSISSNY